MVSLFIIIYNEGPDNEEMLSDKVCEYSNVILITAALVAFAGINPAFAVDSLTTAAAETNRTKSVGAIALLATIDVAACGKGTICLQEAKAHILNKAKERPEVFGAIICTAAVVWCARGVAERVVHRHI